MGCGASKKKKNVAQVEPEADVTDDVLALVAVVVMVLSSALVTATALRLRQPEDGA